MNRILKARIIEHFGTQYQFAQDCKIWPETVSDVVRGKKSLPPDKQEEWAKKLKCPVSDIFPKQKEVA